MLLPFIEVKSIEQNTPLADIVNTITVSIKANCDLLPGSTVTVIGLTGAVTADGALRVVDQAGGFDSQGQWLNGGNLTLTSVGMLRRQTYEARFNLTNPPSSQASPSISVRASVKSVFGDISPIVTTGMTKTGAELLGVVNGSDPLEVLSLIHI